MGRPKSGGAAYTEWALARQAEQRAHVERLRYLTDQARETRRPGQTLEHRVRELADA